MRYVRIAICILSVILAAGCTKPTQPSPESQPKTTQQNRSQSSAAVYPHSDKFISTKVHGLEFFSNPDLCKDCHGRDLLGGNAEVSCQTCHGVFPHTDEFKTTTLHGAEYFKNKTTCTQCHGTDYSGGDSNKSCKECHRYPHPPKWTLPQNHGAQYLEVSNIRNGYSCFMCHGEKDSLKERHPEEFVSCGTCHPLIPHDEEFKYGGGAHRKMARTYQGQCTLCHTDLKRLMPEMGEDGCYSCHDAGTLPIVHWEKP